MISPSSRIYVAGHRGMVGSAIVRGLLGRGYSNIIKKSHDQLDLTSQAAVRSFFKKEKIDYVVLAAAKVGGIHANDTYPADFITTNLQIECNVIQEAYSAGIKDILFLGSSCIYPKECPQPIKEKYLLTGKLEPTNAPYAVAKIAGITMCEAFNRQYGTRYIAVMPTNLYGPDDNFHLENSHVIPAMIRKYHLAQMAVIQDVQAIIDDEQIFGTIPEQIRKDIGLSAEGSFIPGIEPRVVLWGTGDAYREFLHVDDMAAACIHLMTIDSPCPPLINIGSGKDQTIRETAELVRKTINFSGQTIFNSAFPDGTPRKCLDTTKINELGWKPRIGLVKGLERTYAWYLEQSRKKN